MNNNVDKKEYQANQKNQKKLFKKYRKSMWKVVFGIILAFSAMFVLPEYVLPGLNTFLQKFLSSYLAGSITVFTQIGLMIGGLFTSAVNLFRANNTRTKLDEAQDLEEDFVDTIFNEIDTLTKGNDKLKEKVEQLEEKLKNANIKDNEDVRRIINKLKSEVNKAKQTGTANIKQIVEELEKEIAKDYGENSDYRINVETDEKREGEKHYSK